MTKKIRQKFAWSLRVNLTKTRYFGNIGIQNRYIHSLMLLRKRIPLFAHMLFNKSHRRRNFVKKMIGAGRSNPIRTKISIFCHTRVLQSFMVMLTGNTNLPVILRSSKHDVSNISLLPLSVSLDANA